MFKNVDTNILILCSSVPFTNKYMCTLYTRKTLHRIRFFSPNYPVKTRFKLFNGRHDLFSRCLYTRSFTIQQEKRFAQVGACVSAAHKIGSKKRVR